MEEAVKSRQQLMDELAELRQRVAELEGSESHHRQVEESLRESERKYRDLVENIKDVVYIVDKDGVITYVSPSVVNMIGYEPSQLIGQRFIDYVYQEDLPDVIEAFKLLKPRDFRFVTRSGEVRWVRVSRRPIFEGDQITGFQGIATDITESKRAEEEYRALVEHSLQGFLVIQDFRIVFANPALAEIVGYTVEELKSLSSDAVKASVHPEDQSLVWGRMQDRIEGKPVPPRYEYRVIRKDSEVRWLEMFSSRVDYQGKPAIQAAVVDITERKQVEAVLRESQEKLRAQYKGIPIPVYTWQRVGEDFVLRDCNDAAVAITYGNVTSFLGIKASELYQDAPKIQEEISRCFAKKTPIQRDMLYRYRSTGETRYLAVKYAFVPPDLVLVHTEDITQRRRIEEELREHRDHLADLIEERTSELRTINEQLQQEIAERKRAEDQLRSLASQLSLTEEQERRRIATDLHDRIGQTLAMCKIKLGMLQDASCLSDFNTLVDELRELADQAIQSTRSLTFELSSPILYELGLEAAVDSLIEQIQSQHGISFDLEDDGQRKPLGDDVRIVLFQAVRELLVNVVKHAQASSVKISIRRDGGHIRIGVEDNGVGFDASKIGPNSSGANTFGLFNIRERLKHLGGHLEIKSRRGDGTSVTVLAPLSLDNGNTGGKQHEHKSSSGR
jgi:PAS domain S-box-containing protein